MEYLYAFLIGIGTISVLLVVQMIKIIFYDMVVFRAKLATLTIAAKDAYGKFNGNIAISLKLDPEVYDLNRPTKH